MKVDQEHITYDFMMLNICTKNIADTKDALTFNLLNTAGFVYAYNLFQYLDKNQLWRHVDEVKDEHREIIQCIEEQILSLTDKRTSTLEEKLSSQDMLDLYKLLYFNSKKLGIENVLSQDDRYLIHMDRYEVYGGRTRKKKGT